MQNRKKLVEMELVISVTKISKLLIFSFFFHRLQEINDITLAVLSPRWLNKVNITVARVALGQQWTDSNRITVD